MKILAFVLASIVAASAFAQNQSGNAKPSPSHSDVAYGKHAHQALDFWRADQHGTRPLAIYVHGGGFSGGSKNSISTQILKTLLENGIHVAAIEYRFVKHAKLPAAHQDVVRALQFLRSKSDDWGIDKDKVGGWGGSAGAQLVGYLAFHDDLADPDSADPIARQSSRLTCVALHGVQSTMDLNWWLKNIPGYDVPHRTAADRFGGSGEEMQRDIDEVSIINHVTADDPPVYMSFAMAPDEPVPTDPKKRSNWSIHHVNFGIHLLETLRKADVETTLDYPGPKTQYESVPQFLIAKLAPE